MSISSKVALVAAIATVSAVPAASAATSPLSFTAPDGSVVGTMKHTIKPALLTEDGCDNMNTSEISAKGLTPGAAVLLYRNGVAVEEADGEVDVKGNAKIKILKGHGVDLQAGDKLELVTAEEVRTQPGDRRTRVITFANPTPVASAIVPASMASASC